LLFLGRIATDGVAWSVVVCVTIVSSAKRLNRSRWRLGCGLQRVQGSVYRLGVHTGAATWRIRSNRAASMRSYVELLCPVPLVMDENVTQDPPVSAFVSPWTL